MPADLETDYALSALPKRLRDGATVYLLDPKKGYYVAHEGTNGFSTFVNRTQWEWAEFNQEIFEAISYDSEGSKHNMTPFFDVAAMRASGKYTPGQVRDTIINRVKRGTYQAPTRVGISYMLGPVQRVQREDGFENSVMPHYMFYAPRVDNRDIGGAWIPGGVQPFAVNNDKNVLDKAHSIFNYIIIAAGETEKAKILEENKDLLRRLAEYNPTLKVEITVAKGEHKH
jgi:hypothetical protein